MSVWWLEEFIMKAGTVRLISPPRLKVLTDIQVIAVTKKSKSRLTLQLH